MNVLPVSATHAFYAGSFDPLTNGHLSIIRKAATSFDRVVIAIGHNPHKAHLLPLDVRLDLLRQVIAVDDALTPSRDKIAVVSYTDCYLVAAAVQQGCGSIVRGVRNTRDFEDENLLATVNDSLCEDLGLPRLQTHLFNADADKVGISSSMVKAMIGFAGWDTALQRYIPPLVLAALVGRQAELLRSDAKTLK